MAADSARDYLALLEQGDAASLARAFAGPPVIDDPRAGHIEGREALDRFVGESAVWLDNLVARTMRVATTRNDRREVQESVVGLEFSDEPWFLPVAVVLERPSGGGLAAIRVYHSMWPLLGHHQVRPPLLAADPSIALEGAPSDYQRALAAATSRASSRPTSQPRRPESRAVARIPIRARRASGRSTR